MTPDALRRFALSLPETSEAPHFERTSFRTRNKIFATMTRDGKEAMVRPGELDEVEALIERSPDVFFSYGGWTKRYAAMGVRLERVNTAEMKELVMASWTRVAAKRLTEPKKKKQQKKKRK